MRDSSKFGSKIDLVCYDCGHKALQNPINRGKKQFEISTCYKGICDVCGKNKTVTQVRDFCFPIFED